MLAWRILESFCLGVVITVVIFGINAVGGHNSLVQVVTIPLVLPPTIPASMVGYTFTRGHAGEVWETRQLYRLVLFFGGLI
jgi:ABC-type molybdate transport system permease subunit